MSAARHLRERVLLVCRTAAASANNSAAAADLHWCLRIRLDLSASTWLLAASKHRVHLRTPVRLCLFGAQRAWGRLRRCDVNSVRCPAVPGDHDDNSKHNHDLVLSSAANQQHVGHFRHDQHHEHWSLRDRVQVAGQQLSVDHDHHNNNRNDRYWHNNIILDNHHARSRFPMSLPDVGASGLRWCAGFLRQRLRLEFRKQRTCLGRRGSNERISRRRGWHPAYHRIRLHDPRRRHHHWRARAFASEGRRSRWTAALGRLHANCPYRDHRRRDSSWDHQE